MHNGYSCACFNNQFLFVNTMMCGSSIVIIAVYVILTKDRWVRTCIMFSLSVLVLYSLVRYASKKGVRASGSSDAVREQG